MGMRSEKDLKEHPSFDGQEKVFRVVVDFPMSKKEDAVALFDLLTEMGLEPKTARGFLWHMFQQPKSETRLGKTIPRHMELWRTYHIADLRQVCEENEFRANSASTVMTSMCNEGVIERVGVGFYRRIKEVDIQEGQPKHKVYDPLKPIHLKPGLAPDD